VADSIPLDFRSTPGVTFGQYGQFGASATSTVRRAPAPRIPEKAVNAEGNSYEYRAYVVLKELADGRLPLVQVPVAHRNRPVHEVLFMQLLMYMREHGIEDNELVRLLNAQSTAFDRATSRFTVSAGIRYSP